MIPDTPFPSWCADKGITSPLQIQGIGSKYRYLVSPVDAKPGEILKVPLNACIIDDTKESLAERLAHQQAQISTSPFRPYLETMPALKDFMEFPRFWTPERRDFLFDFDDGQVEKRVATDERKELDPWAYACVSSRSNFLGDYTYSLTPFLDFLNHDSSVGTSARITDSNELSLSINADIKANEEVFISYGDLSNIDLLCDYGFVPSSNPCNVEMIEIRLLGSPAVAVAIYPDGSIDKSALALLRQNLASPDEIDTANNRDGSIFSRYNSKISDRNELDVYSLLASFLDDQAKTAAVGAEEAAAANDKVIAAYLSARSKTLHAGIDKILKDKYPDLEY